LIVSYFKGKNQDDAIITMPICLRGNFGILLFTLIAPMQCDSFIEQIKFISILKKILSNNLRGILFISFYQFGLHFFDIENLRNLFFAPRFRIGEPASIFVTSSVFDF